MSLFDYFRRTPKKSASIAKDRLQIVVTREHRGEEGQDPEYLSKLHDELLKVLTKYETIDPEKVKVNLGRSDKVEVLELNIVLPDGTSEEEIEAIKEAASKQVAKASAKDDEGETSLKATDTKSEEKAKTEAATKPN